MSWKSNEHKFTKSIILLALNFYEAIVNCHLIEISPELVV